nr:GFA family protein [Roseovarius litorisediminis]
MRSPDRCGRLWVVIAASAARHLVITLPQRNLLEKTGLKWYRSSPGAQRGFCRTCGISLFWQEDGNDHISVMAGTLDGPTGLLMERHIHADTKGDYYKLPDGDRVDQSTLKFR